MHYQKQYSARYGIKVRSLRKKIPLLTEKNNHLSNLETHRFEIHAFIGKYFP